MVSDPGSYSENMRIRAADHDCSRRPSEAKTKKCVKCEKRKPIDRFSFYLRYGVKKRKGQCKACVNAYHVARREADPDKKRKHFAYNQARRKRLVEEVHRLKSGPCTDCRQKFKPWQMQFDHVRGKKVDAIAEIVRRGNIKQLKAELPKCELVCANCHADRTYKRNKGS